MPRNLLIVSGMVQGVGFRPFVARLAFSLGLTGSVSNTGRGVEVRIQGPSEALAEFRERLVSEAPPMALITGVTAKEEEQVSGEAGFTIEASRVDPFSSIIVPPDIASCPACLAETADPADRRFCYPFTNCTDCGPRYSIIEEIPYDRARTSMKGFTMCPACAAEYGDTANRRFHAQPNACPSCGPQISACAPDGRSIPGDPLELAATALIEGRIVALMGLGGMHLACDASSEGAVRALRERKKRPVKPLAVMAADMEAAKEVANIGPEAQKLLLSPAAPIVLCPALPSSGLAASVAPGQASVGLFIPYTPLHRLLFDRSGIKHLVMTSGNRSHEPIISTRDEALRQLEDVADLFLFHDRPIVHPVDDSVAKWMEGVGPVIIRRARGYAPRPLAIPELSEPVVALGAELLNAPTVAFGSLAFVGPHAGDLKNLETEESLRRTVEHMFKLLRVAPSVVACDMHPGYRSSAFAAELAARGMKLVRVQHHEAHAAACMAENGRFCVDGICIALDGVGFGADGTLRGGEIFAGKPGNFRRAAHLALVPQPGGDAAAVEPWRMAAAWLRRAGKDWTGLPIAAFTSRGSDELAALDAMMARGVNSPLTSSCGRLFDAAAAILGFSGPMLYTAQAPMELEGMAEGIKIDEKDLPEVVLSNEGGSIVVDPAPIIENILEAALSGGDAKYSSALFHAALSVAWVEAAAEVSHDTGLDEVFLTGGCFQNSILAKLVSTGLRKRGLKVFTHSKVPPNDGGISYGQAAWVAMSGVAV